MGRSIAVVIANLIAIVFLYTGSGLQIQRGAGPWYILIAMGVIFQIVALCILVLSIHIKIQGNEDYGEANWVATLFAQIMYMFIFGLVYFISGVIMLSVDNMANVWYVPTVLGIIVSISTAILQTIDLHTYESNKDPKLTVTIVGSTIYSCVGMVLLFVGTSQIYKSQKNDNVEYVWMFFIVAAYVFHCVSILQFNLNVEPKDYYGLKYFGQILCLVLGVVYIICGVISGGQQTTYLNFWLCVSLPGILFVILAIITFIQSQPILMNYYTIFCEYFCSCCLCNNTEEQVVYYKYGDEPIP